MKSIKDQLLKAKLVNKKQARKIEHEERVRQKRLGKEGVQKEKALRLKAQEEKERERKIDQQRQNQREKRAAEVQRTRQGIEALVAGSDLLSSGAGHRRFYFKASDNSIPFLEVSDGLATRLEEGSAAIVEVKRGEYPDFFVVPAGVAEKLNQAAPDAIRFWNRDASS